MTPREDQFERIARYLDGESVTLRDSDREFLAEFRRLEGFAAGRLDEAMPVAAMRSATNRLRAGALWHRRLRRGGRALAVGAGLAAAAAAVIIAVGTLWQPVLPPGSTYSPEVSYVPTEVLVGSLDWSSDLSDEMELVQQELNAVGGQVASWPDADLDDGLKTVERNANTFHEVQDGSLESLLLETDVPG